MLYSLYPTISQDVGVSSRTGNAVQIKSIILRFRSFLQLVTLTDTTFYYAAFRIVIGFLKKPPKSGSMSNLDVLDVMEFNDMDSKVNSDLFTTWVDRSLWMAPIGDFNVTGLKGMTTIHLKKKFIRKWAVSTGLTTSNTADYKVMPVFLIMNKFNSSLTGKVKMYNGGSFYWNYIDL